MVDRVYGKLDEASYRRAIAKLPGGTPTARQVAEPDCHARATSPAQRRGEHGTDGAPAEVAQLADSSEESTRHAGTG